MVPNGSISLYQEGAANIDAGQALELVGREAALVGGSLASSGTMPKATRDLFTQAVDDQRLLEQNALSPLNWPAARARMRPCSPRPCTRTSRRWRTGSSTAPVPGHGSR